MGLGKVDGPDRAAAREVGEGAGYGENLGHAPGGEIEPRDGGFEKLLSSAVEGGEAPRFLLAHPVIGFGDKNRALCLVRARSIRSLTSEARSIIQSLRAKHFRGKAHQVGNEPCWLS
jgi:hypothetical protein